MKLCWKVMLFCCLFALSYCDGAAANSDDITPNITYGEYIIKYNSLINNHKYHKAKELCHNYLLQLGYDGTSKIDYYEVMSNTAMCYYLCDDARNSVLCASLCLYTLSDELSAILSINAQNRIAIMNRATWVIEYCRELLLYYKLCGLINDAILYEDLHHEIITDNRKYFSRYNFFIIPQIGIVEELLYNSILLLKNTLLSTDIEFADMIHSRITDEDIQIAKLYYSTNDISDEDAAIVYMNQAHIGQFTKHLRLLCPDVRFSLTEIDIAIEFVFTFTPKYLTCILLKQDKCPKIVTICSLEDIQRLHANSADAYKSDNSTKLYNLIWSRLEPYLNDGDNVYLSLDSLLHQMNIEVLQDANGKRANEKWNLHRVSSTRELCMEKPEIDMTSAVLYGNLIYDVDSTTMVAQSRTYRQEDNYVASRGFVQDSTMRNGWNRLVATNTEINSIAITMQNSGIEPTIYRLEAGNEESFKALSGKKTPIIHLATHGFFYKDEEAKTKTFFETLDMNKNNYALDNSLKRSGLILAGAQKAWLGEPIPDNVEDGVLLAEEIATMDLTGTDLVVLSACETGLGEITSEGVFGLQRAFKKAGVQTLIMSLWKVDDNATSLFMRTFYKQWLGGKSKHAAFLDAQAAVRECKESDYSNPYYWASFIMLD